jgi:hypothetical protein
MPFDASIRLVPLHGYGRSANPVTAAVWRALLSPLASLGGGAPSSEPLDVIARQVVLKAVCGDMRAARWIADRIEGLPAPRRREAPDDPARRKRVQAAIETLVRFMVERAADAPTMGPDEALGDNSR